jgi:nicotinamide-nucleotide amidase
MLTPYFQDTNSLYLTKRLNDLGLDVHFKTIVGDSWENLSRAIQQSLERSSILIATGGLGPTEDDRTREVLAAVLNKNLIFDKALLDKIEKRFAKRGIKMPVVNKKQAYVLENSVILENKNGTAPGLWIDTGTHTIVLLPGPPHEMQAMFEKTVWPRLLAYKKRHVFRREIRTAGLTESKIESWLVDLYPKLTDIQLTTLACPGQISLHIKSACEKSITNAKKKVDSATELLRGVLRENVFTLEGEELEEVIGKYLEKNNQTLAVAESCTGGFLGHRITNVPGSSAYFLQGVLVYSNQAKIDLLGIPPEKIERFGAVSPQVARAMATGIRKISKADYGLSITGIAGPSGGTKEKPVGLVYTGLATPKKVFVKKNLFLGNRIAIKFQSSQKVLDMLRRYLMHADQS